MMKHVINTKELRESMLSVVEDVRKGAHFTVLYRSHPAFNIVPIHSEPDFEELGDDNPLLKRLCVGTSTQQPAVQGHDKELYGADAEHPYGL